MALDALIGRVVARALFGDGFDRQWPSVCAASLSVGDDDGDAMCRCERQRGECACSRSPAARQQRSLRSRAPQVFDFELTPSTPPRSPSHYRYRRRHGAVTSSASAQSCSSPSPPSSSSSSSSPRPFVPMVVDEQAYNRNLQQQHAMMFQRHQRHHRRRSAVRVPSCDEIIALQQQWCRMAGVTSFPRYDADAVQQLDDQQRRRRQQLNSFTFDLGAPPTVHPRSGSPAVPDMHDLLSSSSLSSSSLSSWLDPDSLSSSSSPSSSQQMDKVRWVVYHAAATRIQAVFRGFRARTPTSIARGVHFVARSRVDHTRMALNFIEYQRMAAGRPRAIERMTAEQLRAEKREIKSLLMRFDRRFIRKHGRLPTKRDKEALRPVYHLYHRVKEAVNLATKAAQSGLAQERERLQLLIEKRQLQHELNAYENVFRRVNGRAIRWDHDVAPVRSQYARYKEIKRLLLLLEKKKKSSSTS
eukprot:TRINITY_DN67072_c0_g1_i2.p1 TRINITY_DN67072_c0_g1~~TRINITY_DN67072_c0_g1_i2.p1  ORF type:complete len:471 (+),score=161.79 TRINITY_DN67072_c0_g1_i2:71-1483(+)